MDLRWMIGEARAGVGAVDPATATAVDPATATAVDPATATAAPVLLYRQWWPFGYRQQHVEGSPALTAGRAQRHVVLWGLAAGPPPIGTPNMRPVSVESDRRAVSGLCWRRGRRHRVSRRNGSDEYSALHFTFRKVAG